MACAEPVVSAVCHGPWPPSLPPSLSRPPWSAVPSLSRPPWSAVPSAAPLLTSRRHIDLLRVCSAIGRSA
jgi:hypothetical protein